MEDADIFPELAILDELTSSTQPSYLFALTASTSASSAGRRMDPGFAHKAKTLPMVLEVNGGLVMHEKHVMQEEENVVLNRLAKPKETSRVHLASRVGARRPDPYREGIGNAAGSGGGAGIGPSSKRDMQHQHQQPSRWTNTLHVDKSSASFPGSRSGLGGGGGVHIPHQGDPSSLSPLVTLGGVNSSSVAAAGNCTAGGGGVRRVPSSAGGGGARGRLPDLQPLGPPPLGTTGKYGIAVKMRPSPAQEEMQRYLNTEKALMTHVFTWGGRIKYSGPSEEGLSKQDFWAASGISKPPLRL